MYAMYATYAMCAMHAMLCDARYAMYAMYDMCAMLCTSTLAKEISKEELNLWRGEEATVVLCSSEELMYWLLLSRVKATPLCSTAESRFMESKGLANDQSARLVFVAGNSYHTLLC